VTAGPPPYPIEGVVSWNLTTACNRRCSYCTQRDLGDRAHHAGPIPAFLEAFRRLPGDWEVKLSGGEPFLHPAFLALVEGLAAAGRRISVVTNFSAPEEEILRFAALTAARPGHLAASLHLEFDDPEAFLARALRYPGRLVVTCVATRSNLPRLPALRDRFVAAGLPFRVQPEKRDREVIAYDEAERALLLSLGGHNGTGAIEPDLSGRPCWAGARYFVLDARGEAWRCYPARRRRREPLGNLLEGTFRLAGGAEICPYPYCNCTVPQERGMTRRS